MFESLRTSLSLHGEEMWLSIWQTVEMMLISLAAAVVVGLPLGVAVYLTGPRGIHPNRLAYLMANAYINIVRSIPFLLFVVALIPLTRVVVGTAFGTTAAALPLSFIAVALYARWVEQTLVDIPAGTVELTQALGVSIWHTVTRFLLLEARSGLILSLTTVAISLLSYSTIMGVVGGGGIGDFAIRYGYQTYEYEVMYLTIVIMVLIVMATQGAGTLIARALDRRHAHPG